MVVFADLNRIVQDYTVSKRGGSGELRILQRRLSNVPVLLTEFEKYLKEGYSKEFQYGFSDLMVHAAFSDIENNFILLNELVEHEEADELIGRMDLFRPVIKIDGSSLSSDFFETTRGKLGELVSPDIRDSTVRVLSSLYIPSVAALYERGSKIHYLEIVLVH